MGVDDKVRHAVDETKGTVKENVGRMTDDERLEAEGKRDRIKADLGQASEKAKDAVNEAFDNQ
jgi:uncharacterized protein YjbJ (UPF0337 family)